MKLLVALDMTPGNMSGTAKGELFWDDGNSVGEFTYEPVHEISNNVVCATSKGSDQPAHTRSLIRAFAHLLNIL